MNIKVFLQAGQPDDRRNQAKVCLDNFTHLRASFLYQWVLRYYAIILIMAISGHKTEKRSEDISKRTTSKKAKVEKIWKDELGLSAYRTLGTCFSQIILLATNGNIYICGRPLAVLPIRWSLPENPWISFCTRLFFLQIASTNSQNVINIYYEIWPDAIRLFSILFKRFLIYFFLSCHIRSQISNSPFAV